MIAELGLALIILALTVSLAQACLLAVPASPSLLPFSRRAAWLQFLCLSGAFIALVALRLRSDFSVANVAEHSSLSLPILYKITGSWGNHEGSMLLWVWVLALFGWLLSRGLPPSSSPFQGEGRGEGTAYRGSQTTLPWGGENPLPGPLPGKERGYADAPLILRALCVQSLLAAGFLIFILLTSNPFQRLFPPPPDGQTLNPLLQDIGLAIHPPLLYLGYVGFSLVFSLAAAALIAGEMNLGWARLAQRWIMLAWSFLTLGIGLGSWWAYRELGWGGFWFWDPVENASLLPWLAGTALLHSNLTHLRRGILKHWTLLLAILTFGLSLLGTFLVRSGLLTSVHSFASDPERGYFILSYMALAIGGGLALFAFRAGRIRSNGVALPISREGMILVNNLFLLTACATVLLGTLYPLLAEALSQPRITVGAPYFNLTFLPIMTIPALLAGVAPLLAWRRGRLSVTLTRLRPAMLAALTACLLILAFSQRNRLIAAGSLTLATWLAAATLLYLKEKIHGHPARLLHLPGTVWSVTLAHFGFALLIAGVGGVTAWQEERELLVNPGDQFTLGGYSFAYGGETAAEEPQYSFTRGLFTVSDGSGRPVTLLAPELRHYGKRGMQTSETAIYSRPWGDIYTVIGEQGEHGRAARVYIKPLINCIWAGFCLMALGGLVSLRSRFPRISQPE